jgi:uncharacterized membrane protein YcaP (DUF421 family)
MPFYLLQSSGGFTWKEFLIGDQEWSFLAEVMLRSFIMFVVIVTALRLLGKRGVKQLSVFELVVIIGLGSAAGDPMFYKEVGLLPAFIVFSMVIILYQLVMKLISKSKKFELLVEGDCVCLISEGRFSIENFKKETLAQDEFFAELRFQGVKHLGQVEMGIIETNGNISLFYYEDQKVKYGLPILPHLFEEKLDIIPKEGTYSCSFCGYTTKLQHSSGHTCTVCEKKKWIKSINELRVK